MNTHLLSKCDFCDAAMLPKRIGNDKFNKNRKHSDREKTSLIATVKLIKYKGFAQSQSHFGELIRVGEISNERVRISLTASASTGVNSFNGSNVILKESGETVSTLKAVAQKVLDEHFGAFSNPPECNPSIWPVSSLTPVLVRLYRSAKSEERRSERQSVKGNHKH